MGFKEPVETTFGEANCAKEKEFDISRHLGFTGNLGLAFVGHFTF